jgi:hypothetical protein
MKACTHSHPGIAHNEEECPVCELRVGLIEIQKKVLPFVLKSKVANEVREDIKALLYKTHNEQSKRRECKICGDLKIFGGCGTNNGATCANDICPEIYDEQTKKPSWK